MARHPLDPASLVAGIAFVVVGAIALLADLSFGEQADLVWPLLLGALGTALLLSSRAAARPHRGREGEDR